MLGQSLLQQELPQRVLHVCTAELFLPQTDARDIAEIIAWTAEVLAQGIADVPAWDLSRRGCCMCAQHSSLLGEWALRISLLGRQSSLLGQPLPGQQQLDGAAELLAWTLERLDTDKRVNVELYTSGNLAGT
eukprot:1152287-Pelagomonas_calceolata.AAC.1